MVLEQGVTQALSLQGEVVEILEKQGKRMARISVLSWNIIDVAGESIHEAHLGDRVCIKGQVTIECIQPE